MSFIHTLNINRLHVKHYPSTHPMSFFHASNVIRVNQMSCMHILRLFKTVFWGAVKNFDRNIMIFKKRFFSRILMKTFWFVKNVLHLGLWWKCFDFWQKFFFLDFDENILISKKRFSSLTLMQTSWFLKNVLHLRLWWKYFDFWKRFSSRTSM